MYLLCFYSIPAVSILSLWCSFLHFRYFSADCLTLMFQYDIMCPEDLWKLTFLSSISVFTGFLGEPLSGIVSDRYVVCRVVYSQEILFWFKFILVLWKKVMALATQLQFHCWCVYTQLLFLPNIISINGFYQPKCLWSETKTDSYFIKE